MPVEDMRALLVTCLQDLSEGERLTSMHIGHVADAATSEDLQSFLRDQGSKCNSRSEKLDDLGAAIGVSTNGQDNIWMKGMFDDVFRDMKTIRGGCLLDIAVIGAVRKMNSAASVSYETAVVVANELGMEPCAAVFGECRDDAAEADRRLREILLKMPKPGASSVG